MKTVNLEEILKQTYFKKYGESDIGWYDYWSDNMPVIELAVEAMREACNQTVDLCKENAKLIEEIDYPEAWGNVYKYSVDANSILNTKSQII